MGIHARAIACAVAIGALVSTTGVAAAQGPAGPNPHSNFPARAIPGSCFHAPMGSSCINAGVRYLDRARARLGKRPYHLPRNFVSLTPSEQALVLTDLDRTLYGLAPVPGLTASLNRDAAAGVRSQNDPEPRGSAWGAYTSNWAGGYPNMVFAYGEWMYDDGPGSGNLDCTAHHTSGCWGHRHDILWRFGRSGALAMGAAARSGRHFASSYAMLLEQLRTRGRPAYTYRWSQAIRAGARP